MKLRVEGLKPSELDTIIGRLARLGYEFVFEVTPQGTYVRVDRRKQKRKITISYPHLPQLRFFHP
ncbi:hypothetical protein J7K41_03410 [Candidatus Micrarchaeota archaeon]|nr:hypothetical protein [Candidatus Micrarchaeota archaeon]